MRKIIVSVVIAAAVAALGLFMLKRQATVDAGPEFLL